MKKSASIHRKLSASKWSFKERRHFIRHPICYPLKFKVTSEKHFEKSSTVNMSEGGLLFLSKRPVTQGVLLTVELPFLDKIFKVKARVMHAERDRSTKLFNIGVMFYRISDALKVKLIEQLYLIDEYRHLRSIQLGREVTLQEASREWIKLYSRRFKKLYW